MTTDAAVPDFVIAALEDVRASGACNMFDRACVLGQIAKNDGLIGTVIWLMGDDGITRRATPEQGRRYMAALHALGEQRAKEASR